MLLERETQITCLLQADNYLPKAAIKKIFCLTIILTINDHSYNCAICK